MMTRRFEQEGISPVVAQEEQTRRGLAALWAGRGWWGGLIACGLAALGQDALIGHGDEPGAGRFYLAAAVVLIVALFHPAWPWRRRAPDELPVLDATKPLPARTAAVETGNGHAPTNGSTAATANGVDHAAALAAGEPNGAPPAVLVRKVRGANGAQPVIVASTTAVATVPVPAAPARPQLAAWVPGAPAAPARRDARSVGPVGRPAAPGIGSGTGDAAPVAPAGPWGRWQATRARLGWRVTVPGLVLTAALAGLSASLLLKEIADPAGGWLWAAALITLLLTFAGAPGWPSGAGLLEGPEDDFFSRGVPRLSPRLEWALVAGLMIVALALRLWNLEYMPGIFGDEGERGMDARAINNGGTALLFGYGWWGVPNLYFYCVAAMLRLFGDNMVGDRMLSVISGAVAVFYVYRIGRLFWGPRAGLLAGALLAVSPLALQFSRLA
ncbi:MAG TPA: glycosyltransferase family 39 protein, partial [Chloroflexia bacterium]|nr:glycosyltransferase family 39 protein [Chloroflexia bacterium]